MKDDSEYFGQDCFRDRNNEERDKRIIGYLSCWHEKDTTIPHRWDKSDICVKCRDYMPTWGNPNLSTPNGYFWLLDAVKECTKIEKLHNYVMRYAIGKTLPFINPTPDQYADLVDEYLRFCCAYEEK